jgi:hypothetical protein
MKKMSDVFKSIRFAKLDPKHDKPEVGGSKDDEEHYTVNTKEWDQQVKHVKKRAMQEEKKDKYDEGEYDQEGDMAKSDLRSIIANAKRLHDMIDDSANLPEWVQSKITVAEDYISTVANYMTAEMSEGVSDKLHKSHQDLRKKSGLPHPDYYKALGKSYDIEDDKERLAHQSDLKKKFNVKEEVKSYVPSPHGTPAPKKPKSEYENKVVKYLKKKYNKEEVEIVDEGIVGKVISKVINKLHSSNAKRPLPQASGRREYEKPKMEEVELQEVAKWRKTSVAKINPDHDPEDWASGRSYDYYHDNPRSTGNLKATSDTDTKYHSLSARPKAEISSQGPRKGMITKQHTQRLKDRIKSSLKKEELELQEGRPSQRHPLEGHDYHKKSNAELIGIAKDAHAAAEAMKSHSPQSENKYRDQANDSATVRYFRQKSGMPDWYKKKYGHVKEEVENLEEKNVPTSPEKWAQAKAQAKAKFDVYPSAYANGWASKKYKEMGGGWKSVSEESILESRKAEIIKKIVKGKKNNNDDKFEPNPIMSKDEDKGRDNINNK